MLRHLSQTRQTRPRPWRGHAMLCLGLVLVSLWLWAGCQPTAQRTPTPPTADTPATAQQENTPPAKPPVGEEHPGTQRQIDTTPDAGSTETGELPPDDYYGDPLYWIPGIDYETVGSTGGLPSSVPILPPEKQRRLEALRGVYWGPDGKPLTADQRARMELAVVAEGMAAVDVAKLIVELGWWPKKYAREFAQQALEASPDDFNTLYLWTTLQQETPTRVEGFRRLLRMKPNSARILLELGSNLIDVGKNPTDTAAALPYLERAAQLAPTAYQGEALGLLGTAYLLLGDGDKALEYLKRAQTIYRSAHRRDLIELIEVGEIP